MVKNASEQSIFLRAIDLPPGVRAAYLDEACRGDPALRAGLDALLTAHDRLGGGGPPTGGGEAGGAETTLLQSSEAAGAVLAGRFKLLGEIGEGGMGTVWMAEQQRPVKRLVAVKLIKAGMGSRAVLGRFEAERQALALMDHPGIARVLDAGTAPDGRPFFVMELVKGVPITTFCDERRLGLRERLGLFVSVCQAVQHAHQKGVIHRDLKPSNVLVALYDGKPMSKVIDFGVAKATGEPLTEQSLHTGFGAVVGTLEYMSPEQASFHALDVDTRSDVYSLGVLLYELLIGGPPFPRKGQAGVLEMLRVIREQEPTKPSAKLSTAEGLPALAASRGTEPKRLIALVRGELDWIVMKALEKDRNQRYDSANGLAADVQRYLADEPVLAGPPSARYRLHKFARRNRRVLTAASAFVLLLVGGVVALTVALLEVRAQKEHTQTALDAEAKRRKQTRAALDAMSSKVIEGWLAKQTALLPEHKQFLEQALREYEEFAADTGRDEESRAGVANAYSRVGSIRSSLGQTKEAEAAWVRSRDLYAALAADGPPGYRLDLARVHTDLGRLYTADGRAAEAEEAYGRALTIVRGLTVEFPGVADYWQEAAYCLRFLGILCRDTDRPREAQRHYEEALAIHRRLTGEFPADPRHRRNLAAAYNSLAVFFRATRQLDKAEAPYREGLALSRRLAAEFPADPACREELGHVTTNFSMLLKDLKRNAEAEGLAREGLALRKQLAADYPGVPTHRQSLARAHNELGVTLRAMGRLDEAEESLRHALTIHRHLAADFPDRPDYQNEAAGTMVNLGRLLHTREDYHGARRLFDEALPYHLALMKAHPRHPNYRFFYRNNRWRLTETLLALKDHAAAAEAAEQFLQAATAPPLDAFRAAGFLAGCARLTEAEQPGLARGYADRAVAALRRAVANGYKDVAEVKKDPALDPLRGREDFKRLVEGLEAKRK